MSSRDKIDTIVQHVKEWSPAERASLAQAILGTLAAERSGGGKPLLEELVGIGRGVNSPPSDQQVKQWIEEHRMRKYG